MKIVLRANELYKIVPATACTALESPDGQRLLEFRETELTLAFLLTPIDSFSTASVMRICYLASLGKDLRTISTSLKRTYVCKINDILEQEEIIHDEWIISDSNVTSESVNGLHPGSHNVGEPKGKVALLRSDH